jgi:hypothetical protein
MAQRMFPSVILSAWQTRSVGITQSCSKVKRNSECTPSVVLPAVNPGTHSTAARPQQVTESARAAGEKGNTVTRTSFIRGSNRTAAATCQMESLDLPFTGALPCQGLESEAAERKAGCSSGADPVAEEGAAGENVHVTEWKLLEAMAGYGVIEGPAAQVVMITSEQSSLVHTLQPLTAEMLRLERSGVRVVERELSGVDIVVDADSALVLWGDKELEALEAAGADATLQRECLIDLVCHASTLQLFLAFV